MNKKEKYQDYPSNRGRVNRLRNFYDAVESFVDLSNLGLYDSYRVASHIGVLKEVFEGRKEMDHCVICDRPGIVTSIDTRFTESGLFCGDCMAKRNGYQGIHSKRASKGEN